MNTVVQTRWKNWLSQSLEDADLTAELQAMAEDEKTALELNGTSMTGQYAYGVQECRMDFYWGEADRVIRYLFHPNHDFEYYYWP